jgi:hypothetical protein
MIQLLRYQLFVHVRMISTYVMVLFVLIAFRLVGVPIAPDMSTVSAMSYTSLLTPWITLIYVIQMSGFLFVFFRSEALQYRIARLRNRHLIIGGALIHILFLALLASIPYAVIYFSMVDDVRIASLALANMVFFNVFVGIATLTISRFAGTGLLTPIIVLVVLFLLPISLMAMGPLEPAFFQYPLGDAIKTLLSSHLDVSDNADMLLMRGVQDTDAIVRTLLFTPLLATITFVRFLRGDHH